MSSILNLQDCQDLYDTIFAKYTLYNKYGLINNMGTIGLPVLTFGSPLSHGDIRGWVYKVISWLSSLDYYFLKITLDLTWNTGDNNPFYHTFIPLLGSFDANNVESVLVLAELPYGFRRKVELTDDYSFGLPQEGDAFGDWHYEDIKKCLDSMINFRGGAYIRQSDNPLSGYERLYDLTDPIPWTSTLNDDDFLANKTAEIAICENAPDSEYHHSSSDWFNGKWFGYWVTDYKSYLRGWQSSSLYDYERHYGYIWDNTYFYAFRNVEDDSIKFYSIWNRYLRVNDGEYIRYPDSLNKTLMVDNQPTIDVELPSGFALPIPPLGYGDPLSKSYNYDETYVLELQV